VEKRAAVPFLLAAEHVQAGEIGWSDLVAD